MKVYNVLVVDDESYIVHSVTTLLECQQELNLDVHAAASGAEALDLLHRMRVDLLISDICMPGMDGITLVGEARRLWPDCYTILLTAYADFSLAYRAIHTDVDRYILKTEPDEKLLEEVRRAICHIDEKSVHMDAHWPREAFEPRELNARLLEQLIASPGESDRGRVLLEMLHVPDAPLWLIAVHAPDLNKNVYPLEWLIRTQSVRLATTKASCQEGNLLFMILAGETSITSLLGCLELAQEHYRAAFSTNLSIVIGALDPQTRNIASAASRMRSFLASVEGYMNDFIYMMPESAEQESRDAHTLFERTVRYIRLHLTEDLSLDALSAVAGYSPTYLSRLFYEKTGEHISAFIVRLKLELLSGLMKDERLSLNEIAERMGFSSRSYFNRYVKRITGETPQHMRENILRGDAQDGEAMGILTALPRNRR